MGLFSRRRATPVAESDQPGSTDHAEPVGADLYEVITPSTLHPIPEWAKVPPIEPLLPEMPRVLSQPFQESLVAWQPPQPFLGTLGHAVTPSAPSGIVTALATQPIATTEPVAEQARAPEVERALPLAVPRPASGESSEQHVSTRRLSLPMDVAAEPSEPSESDAWTAPEPPPVSVPGPDAGSAGIPAAEPTVSDLVGTAPLAPVVEPLVRPLPRESAINPLTQAATPADLPLVELPTARLPAQAQVPIPVPEPDRPPSPPISVNEPVAPSIATASLVGERGIIEPVPASDQTAGSPSEEGAAPNAEAELPLATPPSAPPAGGAPVSRLSPGLEPVAPSAEPAEVAPLLGLAPPLAHDEGEGSVESQPHVPSAGESAAPSLPLAREPAHAEPETIAESSPDAPLLGEAEPMSLVAGLGAAEPVPEPAGAEPPSERPVAEPPVGQSHAPLPARSGLGAPIGELPSTSRSWDLTSLSHADQVRMSRALIQNQMAASVRARGPVGPPLAGPGSRRASTGPTEPRGPQTVLAGMPLPRVAIEAYGPPPAGLTPPELPPAGYEVAPLLSSDRLFGSDEMERSEPAASVEGARARVEIGQRHNVDLTNIPIDRSTAGASEAFRRQARAFTTDQGVVIPPTVGSLDSGPGEALLAHELTHVAQRVRYGPTLPEESTPAGQVLEAEARSAELVLGGGATARAMPTRAPEPTWSAALVGPARRTDPGPPLPLAAATPAGPDVDALAASILDRMSVPAGPGSGAGHTIEFGPASWSMGAAPMAAVAPPAVSMGAQRAPEDEAPPPVAGRPIPDEPVEGSLTRPSDEDLTNLSRWLYPLIKYRLKGDLREDRERAGLITDHYRRW